MRLSAALFALILCLPQPQICMAASHEEITVTPLGLSGVERGSKEMAYRLPMGASGRLAQAYVLVAAQPWQPIRPEPPLAPTDVEVDEENLPLGQVPGSLRITIGGKTLPPWTLAPQPTAYVINVATLKANPAFAAGDVKVTTDLETTAEGVNVTFMGMPDPLLLNDQKDGPLSDFAAAAKDPDVKSYFEALVLDIAGDKKAARDVYTRLAQSKNETVGRFARRNLRLLAYDLRRRKLSGNVREHERWGLYLQQCGLFAAAYKEFDECRILDPLHQESQFRGGEMFHQLRAPLHKILHYMDRNYEASEVERPSDWYVLLVVLNTREGVTLSIDENAKPKDEWFFAERMIWGATGGNLRTWTSIIDLRDETAFPYKVYGAGVPGPAEDIVQDRGWFDLVISVRPRLPNEKDAPVLTVGGSEGPRGAALSSLYADCTWQDYLEAFNQQLARAMESGESGFLPPLVEEALGCGHQPVPDKGYGDRAALHYHMTPALWRRPKVADVPEQGCAVPLWKIEGPFPIAGQMPKDGRPPRHVLDPLPAGAAPNTQRVISDGDFVDIAALWPDAGWALARATAWVYSPTDQEVRMWLGQNDRLAAWINGRCVYEGRQEIGSDAGDADGESGRGSGRRCIADAEDQNVCDTVASWARLRRGWNEVRLVVESWPAPWNKGWGVCVRFTHWDNKPIAGLAYLYDRPDKQLVAPYEPPPPGSYYAWESVKDDYHDSLPRLDSAALERITGVKGLSISGVIRRTAGFIAIMAPQQEPSARYRVLPQPWQPEQDRDVLLNNVLDWQREACAAYRYSKGGQPRDLLVLKPEAVAAYLNLLKEPATAAETFKGLPPADRVLGYVVVQGAASEQFALFVLDTLLAADDNWPIDEEDLLEPESSVYVPNPARLQPMGPYVPK